MTQADETQSDETQAEAAQSSTAQSEAADRLRTVEALETALGRRDTDALTALAADDRTRVRLQDLAANLAVLDGSVRLSYQADPDGADRLQVRWDTGYTEPGISDLAIRFTGDDRRLTAISPIPGEPRPVWLAGPAEIVTGPDYAVVVAAGVPDARQVALRWADAIHPARLDVLDFLHPAQRDPQPQAELAARTPVVLEVVETYAGVDAALGDPGGSYLKLGGMVAPVGAGVEGGAGPAHVLINHEAVDPQWYSFYFPVPPEARRAS